MVWCTIIICPDQTEEGQTNYGCKSSDLKFNKPGVKCSCDKELCNDEGDWAKQSLPKEVPQRLVSSTDFCVPKGRGEGKGPSPVIPTPLLVAVAAAAAAAAKAPVSNA